MQVLSVTNVYASGARRLGAWFIDHLVVGAILSSLFFWRFHWTNDWDWDWDWSNWHWRFSLFSHHALRFAIITLYYAFMESSKYQATLGKIVMGMKVTDLNGQRLEMPKALLRNLSKFISGIIFGIGYIMIIFDDRKQGLHDKIAETFVVRT